MVLHVYMYACMNFLEGYNTTKNKSIGFYLTVIMVQPLLYQLIKYGINFTPFLLQAKAYVDHYTKSIA